MIETTLRGDIAVLTMNHGKANALDIDFCTALADAVAKQKDSAARALVLTGEGAIFSAGVDLLKASDGGPDYLRRFLPTLHRLYETIFFFPKPVIAAINGHAIAGGCILACVTDRKIIARGGGRMGVTELLVGLPFPALAFEVLRHVVANHWLEEVLFTGATYEAEAARERGFADEVVEPGLVFERALAAAEAFAAIAPRAFSQTKQQSRQTVADRLRADGDKVDAAVTAIWTSPEAIKTIDAYVAKTLRKK
ncbi:MAG: enoyl-CoA hydratase/isomerase family protein [Variibacter sp.]